ncbi:DUF1416 domain-containing protein, partial [Streptomyces bambusae]|uniref:DUF1416 domain-containing protein n=1 Tax=Streptomyces bambusae TaxID=1550616 RepID=UPI0027DF0889
MQPDDRGRGAGQGAQQVGDARGGGERSRLHGGDGFTAGVPTSATGQFRFYAAPGEWTLRALVPGGTADRKVVVTETGSLT